MTEIFNAGNLILYLHVYEVWVFIKQFLTITTMLKL
jgi:hypothetical protein